MQGRMLSGAWGISAAQGSERQGRTRVMIAVLNQNDGKRLRGRQTWRAAYLPAPRTSENARGNIYNKQEKSRNQQGARGRVRLCRRRTTTFGNFVTRNGCCSYRLSGIAACSPRVRVVAQLLTWH